MTEMKQVRVNVRSIINKAGVRKDVRNGREVIIAPSATLPDDIVMNGIMYPAAEIAKSFASLDRTPAPLGHPMLNGQFVSASDPEGLNVGYIGAWNENVRRVNGRVLLDKVIDVEVANRTEGGKAVIAALNAGEPVHTSTGLLCKLEAIANRDGYASIARDMLFDHDAILLNTEGAATPAQGVGMLVNGQSVTVINSALDCAEQELDWAGMRLLDALEKRETATLWEKIKAVILGDLVNPAKKETPPMAIDPNVEALNAKVDTLAAGLKTLSDGLSGMISNAIKPLTDNLAAIQANAQAAADAEKADLVAKVTKANLLTEPVAKELTVNALKELAGKIAAPGTAAALNAAFVPAANPGLGDFATYDPNAVINDAMKECK